MEWRDRPWGMSSPCDPSNLSSAFSQKVQTQDWTVDSRPAGTWVTSRNLTYVKVCTQTIFHHHQAQTVSFYRSSMLRIWSGSMPHMSRTT